MTCMQRICEKICYHGSPHKVQALKQSHRSGRKGAQQVLQMVMMSWPATNLRLSMQQRTEVSWRSAVQCRDLELYQLQPLTRHDCFI